MLSKRTAFLIFNFLGLEVTWAACAYGAINESPKIGVYVGIIYIALHFLFTTNRKVDFLVLLTVGMLGILLDNINSYFGVLAFDHTINSTLLIPYWLVVLWFVFSLMVPHSLFWLSKHLKFSILLGAILGSFSYWLGHKLGALQLAEPISISVVILFLEWAIVFPLALLITKSLFTFTNNLSLQS